MTLFPDAYNSGATENTTGVNNGTNPPAAFPKGGGTYTVKVKCVATYTAPCGTTASVTQYKDVPFFVIVPKRVVQLSHYHQVNTGNPDYGHVDTYGLEVRDNQNPVPHGQPYGNGAIEEQFPLASINPPGADPTSGYGSVWHENADGSYSPVTDFDDSIEAHYPTDPNLASNYLVVEFDQVFHCLEQIPPYQNPPFYGSDTTLNTHHVTNYYQDTTTRTGDVLP